MEGKAPAEDHPLEVAVFGLGRLGRDLLAAAHRSSVHRVVGVADPAHAGEPVTALLGAETEVPLRVEADSRALLERLGGGVALVATHSRLAEVAPLLSAAAQARVHVVSTCEELAYPWLADPDLAERLDHEFADAGRCCLGTGVNPGFVLDRLPVVVGAVSGEISRVHARRLVDVATRRAALQHKVGAGLPLEEFEARVEGERLGHVGLPESVALVADGLNLTIDEIDEETEPVVAREDFDTGHVRGRAGDAAGARQTARGFSEGREVIRLELAMAVGLEEPRDEVTVEGDPRIELRIPGGIPGGPATVRAALHAAEVIGGCEPGLLTILDLPIGR